MYSEASQEGVKTNPGDVTMYFKRYDKLVGFFFLKIYLLIFCVHDSFPVCMSVPRIDSAQRPEVGVA